LLLINLSALKQIIRVISKKNIFLQPAVYRKNVAYIKFL